MKTTDWLAVRTAWLRVGAEVHWRDGGLGITWQIWREGSLVVLNLFCLSLWLEWHMKLAA